MAVALTALISGAAVYWWSGAASACGSATQTQAYITSVTYLFDKDTIGKVPKGWKVEATRPRGPLATWKVINEKGSSSGNRVLAITSINHHSAGTFNLCWNPSRRFKNGEITVRFKAVSGKTDQGGGIMWRVRDRNNYYVARFNPLEDNFRFYYVKNGHRHMIASADVKLPPGWHTMKIKMDGSRFTGYLDGRKYLEATSSIFRSEGGVGLWTKADAATMFDDFTIRVRHTSKPQK